MEKEKIGVWGRVRMAGLKNKAFLEISEDPKRADYVLIMGVGIQRKWLLFNFPEEAWRVRCSKEEVLSVVNLFLNERILV